MATAHAVATASSRARIRKVRLLPTRRPVMRMVRHSTHVRRVAKCRITREGDDPENDDSKQEFHSSLTSSVRGWATSFKEDR